MFSCSLKLGCKLNIIEDLNFETNEFIKNIKYRIMYVNTTIFKKKKMVGFKNYNLYSNSF